MGRCQVHSWLCFFSDLPLPCAVISKVIQQDSLDILEAFSCLLHIVQEWKKFGSKPLLQWPSYSSTLQSFTEERDTVLFQQQIVKH